MYYVIEIDYCPIGDDNLPKENIPIVYSPFFKSPKTAYNWYKKLNFEDKINVSIDVIMLVCKTKDKNLISVVDSELLN